MEKTNIITEILEAFRIFDGKYKREQVDAAIELKKEITPHLIEILETGTLVKAFHIWWFIQCKHMPRKARIDAPGALHHIVIGEEEGQSLNSE